MHINLVWNFQVNNYETFTLLYEKHLKKPREKINLSNNGQQQQQKSLKQAFYVSSYKDLNIIDQMHATIIDFKTLVGCINQFLSFLLVSLLCITLCYFWCVILFCGAPTYQWRPIKVNDLTVWVCVNIILCVYMW